VAVAVAVVILRVVLHPGVDVLAGADQFGAVPLQVVRGGGAEAEEVAGTRGAFGPVRTAATVVLQSTCPIDLISVVNVCTPPLRPFVRTPR
jgi:hypothetical protein